MTNIKIGEIENLIDENSLMCLTETQLRSDKVIVSDKFTYVHSMRKEGEKKGGGLMAIYTKVGNKELAQHKTRSSDIMHISYKENELKMEIVIVYLPAGTQEEDKKKRREMRKELEEIIEKELQNSLLLIGDFNCHVGFLGSQKIDEGGNMILDWLENYGLIMLNNDPQCKGLYTWESKEQKSVIDFALINQNLYEKYVDMEIDDNKVILDISDHNLLKVKFKNKKGKELQGEERKIEYYKKDTESLKLFIRKLEEECGKGEIANMENFEATMKKVADDNLIGVYKRRSTETGNEEPPWLNVEIKREIKLRKSINRELRNTQDEQEKKRLRAKYDMQKKVVQNKIKEEMYIYEEKKTREIKQSHNSGKKLWEHVNKLRGKATKNKEK